MVWGYLSEFWDKLTDVGEYTIEWFQGIGNAVAGAIGSLFEDLIHHIYDFFYIAQYLIDNLGNLFAIIFTPLTWIFNFVKGFFVSAFAPPVEPTITWTFSNEILSVFNAIPYWNIFIFAIGSGIAILVLVFIFKRLTSI
jgi:hypothetical protein